MNNFSKKYLNFELIFSTDQNKNNFCPVNTRFLFWKLRFLTFFSHFWYYSITILSYSQKILLVHVQFTIYDQISKK